MILFNYSISFEIMQTRRNFATVIKISQTKEKPFRLWWWQLSTCGRRMGSHENNLHKRCEKCTDRKSYKSNHVYIWNYSLVVRKSLNSLTDDSHQGHRLLLIKRLCPCPSDILCRSKSELKYELTGVCSTTLLRGSASWVVAKMAREGKICDFNHDFKEIRNNKEGWAIG